MSDLSNAQDVDGTGAADKSHWRKLWDLFDSRERREVAKVLGVAILAAAASTFMVGSVMPFLSVLSDPSSIESSPRLTWLYDRFEFKTIYGFLIALGLGSLTIIVTAIALQLVNIFVSARFALLQMHSLSRKLLSGYLGQPYEFFLNRNTGEMSTRVLSEVEQVVSRLILPSTDLVTSSLTIASLVLLLIWVDPVVTMTAFGVLGATYGGIYLVSRIRLNALGKIRAARNAERYQVTLEAFGGIKEIKLLGREGAYINRYSESAIPMAHAMIKTQIISQTPYYSIQAIALSGVILLCLLLITPAGLASGNTLPTIIPLLGVFAFAGQRMMPELGKLYQSIAKIQSTRAALDHVYADVMDARAKVKCSDDSDGRIHLQQEFRLDEVTYRYPDSEAAGVTALNFQLRVGEKVGIVGGTGAGKTTMADLILGLLEPQSGTISSDGSIIDAVNVGSWQKSVGYVPQDIFLSDASITQNIALGLPLDQIDEARVIAAGKAAQLDGFITRELPKGYETFVGERGVRLSGGQRQRIGIARALYHDAELIVFDEATSALDNMTEAEVISAIDSLPGSKTVLMIAHRLSTVKKCDRIIVMDAGRIVGCGSWDELMHDNAAFQRIAKLGETT